QETKGWVKVLGLFAGNPLTVGVRASQCEEAAVFHFGPWYSHRSNLMGLETKPHRSIDQARMPRSSSAMSRPPTMRLFPISLELACSPIRYTLSARFFAARPILLE